jgi:16S rRNA (cytosine967-C5)-methyltransferase
MVPAARLSAAMEVLADIEARRRPASDALKDWGLSHRFAGSKDRAAIASLVYDSLRRRASASWIMGEGTPRAALLGMLRLQRGLEASAVAGLFTGERFAPPPLTEGELERLRSASLDGAPASVAGDFPDWIERSLARALGDDLVPEMQALAGRAPLDIRANGLKVDRDQVAHELRHLEPRAAPHSPLGLRLPVGEDGRGPALQAEPSFQNGWFEIQDEGSQLAALAGAAVPGETVIDLCAGGGGKTLALAAMMGNEGRIVATDSDMRRLAPIHERLRRAGATGVEVRTPRPRQDVLADLAGMADLVFVDAPCTGTGTWRRNPDAKWRLRPGSLAQRVKDQGAVLDRAAALVRPGGRILYVTCSLLPEENDDAIRGALERQPSLTPTPIPQTLVGGAAAIPTEFGIQLTPRRAQTDGFYLAGVWRGGG